MAIQLCVLGCYDAIAKRLEKLGPVATHILPACAPMLACRGLNSNQFEMAVGIVQGMLETVIAYRREQIANPSATAIIENKPTHPGGEPDEAEIARQRIAALGGWKAAAPAASNSKLPASRPLSPVSATFPGAGKSSSPVPAPAAAAASSSGFDMSDMFSAPPPPPPSAGSPGARPAPYTGRLSPVGSSAMPAAAAAATNGDGRPSGYGSSSSAADMFQGLSISQTGPNGTSGGFGDVAGAASAGLGAGNVAPAGGGMSWMDDALGGGGGPGNGFGSSGGMGSSTGAPGANPGAGMGGGFSGLGATPSGMLPPPPAAAGGVSSPPASGASAGDPFAAFFDAAIAGGSGATGSPQLAPSASPSTFASSTAGGAPPAFMGGFGSGPMASSSGMGGGGAGSAGGGGGGGGGGGLGGSIEDQLAKTQREIAQLTRELGSAGSGMMAGLAAGGAMAAAMGGAGGITGWAMPGAAPAPAAGPAGGGTGMMPGWPGGGMASQQAPARQQGKGADSSDPFAFLEM